jgi:hypothetical protein
MTRKLWTFATLLGVAVSLLLGSGLLAFTSNSVWVQDSQLTSGTFEAQNNLQVKKVATRAGAVQPFECGEAGYSAGPIQGEANDFDFSGGFGKNPVGEFCFRNFGVTGGDFFVQIPETTSGETDCSPGEAEAGDPDCGSGPGELAEIIRLDFIRKQGGDGFCPDVKDVEMAPSALPGAATKLGHLDPGETCRYGIFGSSAPNATDEGKLKAQTDFVQWPMFFTLPPSAS